MKKIIILLVLMFALSNTWAQKGADEIQRVLSNFKNYRFGSIRVYEVIDASEVKEILDAKKAAKTGGGNNAEAEKVIKDLNPQVVKIIEERVTNEETQTAIQTYLITNGFPVPPEDQFEIVYKYFVSKINPTIQNETKVYVVTMLPSSPSELPKDIIGVVTVEKPFDEMTTKVKDNLEDVTVDNIYSYRQLRDFNIDPNKYSYATMMELIESYFIQGNVENKTMETKGIGGDVPWFGPEYGVASSLIDYKGFDVKDTDIQLFKRISNGEPNYYFGTNNEIFVGPDRVAWTNYPAQYATNRKGEYLLDSITGERIKNTNIPSNYYPAKIGVEVKYGIDNVNMPSFYSERMALNVLWQNVKFGLILPTNGWASLSNDLYNQQRKMTYAGFGINGELDFSFPIIPRSDVFHLSFGYVFSDAEPAPYKEDLHDNWNISNPVLFDSVSSFVNPDYLVRANASLHYTFGMNIDKDYLLRFSLGGAFYNIENWIYQKTQVIENQFEVDKVVFNKFSAQSIGGISGKVDFMATNKSTPFGISLNYFDESFMTNAFIQVNIIDRVLALKLNAVGRFNIKTNDRAWEPQDFFQPMLNVIYLF